MWVTAQSNLLWQCENGSVRILLLIKGHSMSVKSASTHELRHIVPAVSKSDSGFNRIYRGLLAGLGAGFLLVSGPALAGPAVAPPLGVAEQFGAWGNSGVTGSAVGSGTAVNGDVASGPTTVANSNFPPSSVVPPFILHAVSDAVVNQAAADANTAYLFMQGQVAGDTPLGNNLDIVGVLQPGLYSTGAGLLGATSLTLNDPTPDNSGIFVFNVASSLTMSVGSSVIGTADPCNVYWRVGSDATLNGTSFMGTVIADRSITVGGGNVSGRVLAGAVTGTGVVTMPTGNGNTIGGCSLNAPLVLGATPPTISKSFLPTSINSGSTSTLTITLSNTSIDTVDNIVTLTDNLPLGVLIAGVPNASTTCPGGGVVGAPAGGGTVTLTGGQIPAGTLSPAAPGTCTVTVDVTSSVSGIHVNTIPVGGLTTDNGNNAAPAIADLTVVALAPTDIPTLSEWAMILLASLLAMAGLVAVRRQTS
jgi:uncharacterized repeat protein (TIGR01451 family)